MLSKRYHLIKNNFPNKSSEFAKMDVFSTRDVLLLYSVTLYNVEKAIQKLDIRSGSMIRKATKMKVYHDCYETYKKRHNELWPEMEVMLKAHGAHNYSIFLDEESGVLFAYIEIECEDLWAQTAQTEICQKWWEYMSDIMETNADNSPKSRELKEVFYLK